jgi:hypothetical protein
LRSTFEQHLKQKPFVCKSLGEKQQTDSPVHTLNRVLLTTDVKKKLEGDGDGGVNELGVVTLLMLCFRRRSRLFLA